MSFAKFKFFSLVFLLSGTAFAESKTYTAPSGKLLKPTTKIIKNLSDAKQYQDDDDLESSMRARPTYELLNADKFSSKAKKRKVYYSHGSGSDAKPRLIEEK